MILPDKKTRPQRGAHVNNFTKSLKTVKHNDVKGRGKHINYMEICFGAINLSGQTFG